MVHALSSGRSHDLGPEDGMDSPRRTTAQSEVTATAVGPSEVLNVTDD